VTKKVVGVFVHFFVRLQPTTTKTFIDGVVKSFFTGINGQLERVLVLQAMALEVVLSH
jgi:hypothetical protein